MKTLSAPQLEQAKEALVAGYHNWSKLNQLVAFALDTNLEVEVGKFPALGETAFELLRFAEARGWTELLLREAAARNPGNPKLQALSTMLGLAPAPFRAGSRSEGYEALISGQSGLESVGSWRKKMILRERCVCQILRGDTAIGTGFLLGPALVMSNWHVFETAPGSRKLGRPEDYAARFDFRAIDDAPPADPGMTVGFDAASGFIDQSDKSELDYAILSLSRKVGDELLPDGTRRGWLTLEDRQFSPAESCVVLQHPMRRTLEVAIGAVRGWVKDSGETIYEHLADTERGSSGSPCFAPNWQLLGLHHRVDPVTGECNRAIASTAILARLGKNGKFGLLPQRG